MCIVLNEALITSDFPRQHSRERSPDRNSILTDRSPSKTGRLLLTESTSTPSINTPTRTAKRSASTPARQPSTSPRPDHFQRRTLYYVLDKAGGDRYVGCYLFACLLQSCRIFTYWYWQCIPCSRIAVLLITISHIVLWQVLEPGLLTW